MNKLKLAYFGTPDFSAALLEKLINDKSLPIEIKLVVTQPDRKVGRQQILTPSPVKLIAQKYNIPVYHIKATGGAIGKASDDAQRAIHLEKDDKTRTKISVTQIYKQIDKSEHQRKGKLHQDPLAFIDLGLLCALGAIIPASSLNVVKYGIWNIHYSTLPYYRGPSPTAYSLIFNENKTGVTIFKMDEKIDHGPIIAKESLIISKSDYRPDLILKQTDLAYKMFKKIMKNVIPSKVEESLSIALKPQDESKATYTRRLTKQDGYIPLSALGEGLKNESLTYDELPTILKEHYLSLRGSRRTSGDEAIPLLNNSAQTLYNYFRGLYPWPGLWTMVKINGMDKRLKIVDMSFLRRQESNKQRPVDNWIPGQARDNKEKLTITRVQLEGKNEVDFATFNKAYKVF